MIDNMIFIACDLLPVLIHYKCSVIYMVKNWVIHKLTESNPPFQ